MALPADLPTRTTASPAGPNGVAFVADVNAERSAINDLKADVAANVVTKASRYLALDGSDEGADLNDLMADIKASGRNGSVVIDGTVGTTVPFVLRSGVGMDGMVQGQGKLSALAGFVGNGIMQHEAGPVKRAHVKRLIIEADPSISDTVYGAYFDAAGDAAQSDTGGLWHWVFDSLTFNNNMGVWLRGGGSDFKRPHQFNTFRNIDIKYQVGSNTDWIGLRITGQCGQNDFITTEITGYANNDGRCALWVGREIDDAEAVLSDSYPYSNNFHGLTLQKCSQAASISRGYPTQLDDLYIEGCRYGVLAKDGAEVDIGVHNQRSATDGSDGGYIYRTEGATSRINVQSLKPIGTIDSDPFQVGTAAVAGSIVVRSVGRVTKASATTVVDATGLHAETSSRWVRYATGIEAISAGDGTFTKQPLAIAAGFVPYDIGSYYMNPMAKNTRLFANAVGDLRLHLYNSGPEGCTIDTLDCNVTTIGSAGAVVRAGLYLPRLQGNPFQWSTGTIWADLLTDAGTVVGDSGTGKKTWTLSVAQVIAPNVWFAVGGVNQVNTSTREVGGLSATSAYTQFGSDTGSYLAKSGIALASTGVTGALGATFTPAGGVNGIDGGVGIHRSA